MTGYRAALPMYDLPELRADTDRLWQRIAARLPGGTDVTFERPAGAAALRGMLADPGLLLSQTCWGPISLGLTPPLTILAQPDYTPYPGGAGPCYRSAVIMRGAGRDRPPPRGPGAEIPPRALCGARLAFNERASLSGFLSLQRDSAARAGALLRTGSHRESLRAVAGASADVAAIDCRTWAHLRRHDPAARNVRVIGWTALRTGLPYVAAPGLPPGLRETLCRALAAGGAHPPGPPRLDPDSP